jgi:epoxyqueuosine reductase
LWVFIIASPEKTVSLDVLAAAAQQLGFSRTAALPVAAVEQEFRLFYEDFLARGLATDLSYLSRPERFDLRSIFPSAHTLLIFFYPYRFNAVEAKLRAAPLKVARYAWQKDYHVLLRGKLSSLLARLGLTGRAITDSAPLLERYWARRAGLGFIGRSGMLIDPETGSYFLVAAALIEEQTEAKQDIPLRSKNFSPENDFTDFCKDCRLCIDACPTGALFGDGLMETSKCISYRTIEAKTSAQPAPSDKKHRWVFGCDICQQVCPYNKTAASFADDEFNDEHPAAEKIAADEIPPQRSALKLSAFFRRGVGKILGNRAALEPR